MGYFEEKLFKVSTIRFKDGGKKVLKYLQYPTTERAVELKDNLD